MTYNVFGGTLNLTQSINQSIHLNSSADLQFSFQSLTLLLCG